MAEVDSGADPAVLARLDDCLPAVNDLFKRVLDKARARSGRASEGSRAILDTTYRALGGKGHLSACWAPIERWLGGLGPGSVHQVPQDRTKYRGVRYGAWPTGLVLCPVIKLGGRLVGTDKLGHFAQQGYQYYVESLKYPDAEEAAAVIAQRSSAFEVGCYGLRTTGVYSHADIAAEYAGWRFYADLAAQPDGIVDIGRYVTDAWNEEANPNWYAASVAEMVWPTLLQGRVEPTCWTGQWIRDGGVIPITVRFRFAGTGDVSFDVTRADGALLPLAISHGRIMYRTTTDNLVLDTQKAGNVFVAYKGKIVIGVRIHFEWSSLDSEEAGTGYLESTDERTLEGRLTDTDTHAIRLTQRTVPGAGRDGCAQGSSGA